MIATLVIGGVIGATLELDRSLNPETCSTTRHVVWHDLNPLSPTSRVVSTTIRLIFEPWLCREKIATWETASGDLVDRTPTRRPSNADQYAGRIIVQHTVTGETPSTDTVAVTIEAHFNPNSLVVQWAPESFRRATRLVRLPFAAGPHGAVTIRSASLDSIVLMDPRYWKSGGYCLIEEHEDLAGLFGEMRDTTISARSGEFARRCSVSTGAGTQSWTHHHTTIIIQATRRLAAAQHTAEHRPR